MRHQGYSVVWCFLFKICRKVNKLCTSIHAASTRKMLLSVIIATDRDGNQGCWRCSINHICTLYSFVCGSNSKTCFHFMGPRSSLATRILKACCHAGEYVNSRFIVFLIVFYKDRTFGLRRRNIYIIDWNRLEFRFSRFWHIMSGVRRF